MQRFGSQRRETLAEGGYVFVSRDGDDIILRDADSTHESLWTRRDDYAGYVVEHEGHGYEFVRSLE